MLRHELLTAKILVVVKDLSNLMTTFLTNEDMPTRFVQYLQAQYGIVCASVPLMQTAVVALRRQSDALAPILVPYFERHIAEETDHDRWLLEDLARLGAPPRSVAINSVASMVGAQYYFIHHVHPVVLLGYIFALENFPPPRAAIETAMAQHHLDPVACRTVLFHATEDPMHARDLNDLVDRLPLTTDQFAMMGLNAMRTVEGQTQVLAEIVESGAFVH